MALTRGPVRNCPSEERPAEGATMRFRVLGPLEVEGDDGPLPIVGQRPRALLTALLMRPNEVVAPEALVDAVWGEDLPEAPGNALQQVVTRLRSRLHSGLHSGPHSGPHSRPGARDGVLVTAPGGYRVVVASDGLDADRFEAGYRRARGLADTDPEAAIRELEAALALWRGPAYGEFATSFAQAASVRLTELRTAAAEDRVELLVRTGAVAEAVATARELVETAPLRERPVELLMRGLHAGGRVADALEAYRRHRQLLADELGLDPPAGLRELEARILQDDLPGPVRPPAPAPSPGPPGRVVLPGRPGAIIGREDELTIVRGCLADLPLVSLVGPGGVGKTRLALELAHEQADQGPQVVWVDLSTIEPGRLGDLVAEGFGVDMPRGQDPHTALAGSLHGSSALVCLDNAETVLGEVAPLVEALLDHAPHLRILATSRERLAVHTEHVHRVSPLPLPSGPDADNPAVRLFLARASGLGEAITDAALEDVAVLCRRLDGLPLAIELGAAQAPIFGIRQLTEHITGELDLLAGGRRTSAARHRTLRAVVDTSYGLLTPGEAALFLRLAVFPGRFTLQDVRSVCADDGIEENAVGPLLARLAEQSLVQSDQGRFWLLDTLRTYALERLDQGEYVRMRGRHARLVAQKVSELRWQQQPETEAACVNRLGSMTPDLHAAWAYATNHDALLGVELAALVYDFAYQRQRLDLLDWGRRVAEWDLDHPDLGTALATGAAGAWAAGDLKAAERLARRGMTAPDGSARPRSSSAISQAGNLAMFFGDFDQAIRLYEECIAASHAEGMPVTALLEEIAICQVHTYAGRGGEARERMVDLRRRASAMGNPSAIAWAGFVTGEAIGDTDVPAALAAYRSSVERSLEVDNRLFLGLARSSAVALAARHGAPRDALAEFERVVAVWDELGNVTAQWWVLMHLAVLFARLDEDRPAALLAGAILNNEGRTYALLGDEDRLRDAVREVTARLGEDEAQRLLDEGRHLSIEQGVALARVTMEAVAARDPSP
jgi:predicted ATPase/DNA-binding SARP family transcriptional activator